ncbi:MAG: ATP-binding protein [Deferrisomatales bacterium]|nr:ATP-binding protein [Deferrisomatales bacterium]
MHGYLVGRSVVLLALLVLAGAFQARQGGFPVPLVWFFACTGASFLFTLASVAALRRGAWQRLSPYLQPAWDVAYATALVYLSGGAFSPFAMLYPLAILGGAILLLRRGALAVATASALAYGLLVDLQFYGVIQPLSPLPLPALEGGRLLLQLLFNILAFYAVALLSGYLAEELHRAGVQLEEAQAEVLDLERLRDSILQGLGSGLVALDRRSRRLFHNRAAEELLGRAGVSLGPDTEFSRLFPPGAGGRSEARFLGGSVVLGYSHSPLSDRGGRRVGSILIFQDLTQVKQLEEGLRRADRLAAVGRLAAGLAHEIRNPLASLSGSVEVLRQGSRTDAEDAHLLEIVLRETERLNRLVTNFLHYARPGSAEPTPFPLRELVADIGFFFSQGEGRTGFVLENAVPEGLCLVADRSQVEQVLLNLFRNSVEAAPGGVTVRVGAAEIDGGAEVTVRDDGPGIPPDVAARAFEPFFSGREGGTGLGLATVHRIMENHGGAVSLGPGPAGGSALRLRFPSSRPVTPPMSGTASPA